MAKAPRVLIMTSVPDRIEQVFRARFPDLPLLISDKAEDLDRHLEEFQPTVIFAFTGEPVAKVDFPKMLHHPSVEWFSNGGAGIEHLGKWDTGRKTVTNASGVNAPYLAQFTIAAHLSVNVGLPRFARLQQQREWTRHAWQPLTDRKFCVVGLGSIGRLVAQHAKYFGLHTVGTRATPRPTDHVDEVYGAQDLLTALSGSDFVSVHTAATPDTVGLIGDDAFDAMADGVIFLNASRGSVVQEDALMRALDSGKIGTAILDVFQTEPLPKDHPLWAYDNVIVTPHVADTVLDWEANMTRAFCDNLDRWLKGDPLESLVDPDKGY